MGDRLTTIDMGRKVGGGLLCFLANEYAIARPSVVCLSVTLVRPTQEVQIFGNISTVLGTLAIR